MKKAIVIKNQKYFFNGKEYNNKEDLPKKFKKMLEDKDEDGIPDVFENVENGKVIVQINGEEFDGWDKVPQEYQEYRNLLNQDFHNSLNKKAKHNDRQVEVNLNLALTKFIWLAVVLIFGFLFYYLVYVN